MTETRKVQLAGGSTYTVSLPKEWARRHGIDPGNHIHLYPHEDGSLVVRPRPASDGLHEVEVDAGGHSVAALAHAVRALYGAGFDAVTVTAPGGLDAARREAVTAATEGLVGMEATDEDGSTVGLRAFLSTGDVSLRQTVTQLRRSALDMYEDALRAVATADADLAERVRERKAGVDRQSRMVDRYYRRSLTDLSVLDELGADRQTVADCHATARNLEAVAGHAVLVADAATRLDAAPPPDLGDALVDVGDRVRAIVDDATGVLLAGTDADRACAAVDAGEALASDVDALEERVRTENPPDAASLGAVLASVRRTAAHGVDIAETVVQAAARNGDL